jgi:hypothetical protein
MSESICNQLSDVIIRERVKNMLAIATRYDNPLRSKEFEPLRNGWQVVLKSLGQFRNAHFSVREHSQKAQSTLVSESAKNRSRTGQGIRVGGRKSLFRPTVVLAKAFCIRIDSHNFLAQPVASTIDCLGMAPCSEMKKHSIS